MIVSHKHAFIFFHNPKCAGTSMREALAPHHDDPFSFWGIFEAPYFRNAIDHTHLRLWELQALFPSILEAARSYRSVILVRNPYRRFLSALDEHFKKFQAHAGLAGLPAAGQVKLVEHFIEETLTIGAITTDYRFIHFSPQTWFIVLGGRRVPGHVLAMDDQGEFAARAFACLGLPPRPLAIENRSRGTLAAVFQSEKIRDFVRRFYAMDFECFAADPDLRDLTRLPPVQAETPLPAPGHEAARDDHQAGFPGLFDTLRAFREDDYLTLYPDIRDAVRNGLFADGWAHYERHGRAEGRRACLFDEAFYLRAYPPAARDLFGRLAANAYQHYLMFGRARGYAPHAGAERPSEAPEGA